MTDNGLMGAGFMLVMHYLDGTFRVIMSRLEENRGTEATPEEVQCQLNNLPFKAKIGKVNWLTVFRLVCVHAKS